MGVSGEQFSEILAIAGWVVIGAPIPSDRAYRCRTPDRAFASPLTH